MPHDELDAISVPELRRRVDLAVAHVREMRRALAVQAGMTLENAPGPIPQIDPEEGRIALQQMMETLPLLQRRLTPAERAQLRPISEARNEQMKEVLDELVADKDAYEELARDSELPSHEQVVKMRESLDKAHMIHELERELVAYREELTAFRHRLEERIAEAVARMVARRESAS